MAQHNALALPKARGDRRALAGEGDQIRDRLIVAKARYESRCIQECGGLIEYLIDIERNLDGLREISSHCASFGRLGDASGLIKSFADLR
jgi:hypothetical protein